MNDNNENIPASAQKQYNVTQSDLPLSCPMPHMVVWNAHPRVYLPVEKTGAATCPYCSANFVLTDFKPSNT